MLLWTYHVVGYCLFTGRRDPARCHYHRTQPGLADAYRLLHGRLGTDQILWCHRYQQPRGRTRPPFVHGPNECEWTLSVPDDAVLAFVDTSPWSRLVQGNGLPGDDEAILLKAPRDHDTQVVIKFPARLDWKHCAAVRTDGDGSPDVCWIGTPKVGQFAPPRLADLLQTHMRR